MRFEGIVKSWNEERGFGFIEPAQGGQEIFCHITALPARAGKPAVNMRVSFEVDLDHEGKKRAKQVRLISPASAQRPRRPQATAAWRGATLFSVPAFVLLYLALAALWRVPNLVGVGYVVLSVLCFMAYAGGKSAAAPRARRTRESGLLLLSLLGGWPGGILAQQFLRRKSTNASFRSAFWVAVWVNVGAFVALSSPALGAWRWLR